MILKSTFPAGSRRDFVGACLRYPAMAAMAAFGAWLAWRDPDPSRPQPCIKARICRDCGLMRDCPKPQAVAARKDS